MACYMGEFLRDIIFFVVGLFILNIVIETAVRKGINNSNIGQLIEKVFS